MTLRKSTDGRICGTVAAVNAIMSSGLPGTAADMILPAPSAVRIAASSCGYAAISHARSALGTRL